MTATTDSTLVAGGPALETAGLAHRVRVPAQPGPHRAVVMLHGRSGDESAMWIFSRAIPRRWLIVAPRGIKPDPDGGFAWHPRKRDEWPPLPMFDEAVSAVVRLIRALPQLYDADPGGIHLMGFSQGAATAYATALRHPGLVKGIAGLVGFMPEDVEDAVAGSPLANLPAFMAVGRRDPAIPLERAAACALALRQAGALLDYHEYEARHKLNADALRDLAEWWKSR